jgi:hypothetical protein
MEEIIVTGQGEHTIPLSLTNLTEGVYFYTLQTNEGTISGKFLH